MDFRDYMKDNKILFDGAMGTMLQKNGLKLGENTEIYGLKNKEILKNIHMEYLKVGSDVITTNTFGANFINLEKTNYSIEDVVKSSVEMARSAINEFESNKNKYIAMSIGPTGILLKSNDKENRKNLRNSLEKQLNQGNKESVDLILIETMIDLDEALYCIDIAKNISNIPIACTMTFGKDNKTLKGNNIDEVISKIEKSNIDMLGVNCSYGPKQVNDIAKYMINKSNLPIVAQPNLGIPRMVNNKPVYDISNDEFIKYMTDLLNSGIKAVGGCCGTTPKDMEELGCIMRK